jgi:hypothetical protein
LPARHVLLIADACFGGSIFRQSRGYSGSTAAISILYGKRSRKAMTSGGFGETPDDSKFLQYLVKHLKENREKYISAEQLFYGFNVSVMDNSNTIPKYGTVLDADNDMGEFIFVRRTEPPR